MVHIHNRDFLFNIQYPRLVRPELIRSKDGTIDGDGWQCWDCRSVPLRVFPVGSKVDRSHNSGSLPQSFLVETPRGLRRQ